MKDGGAGRQETYSSFSCNVVISYFVVRLRVESSRLCSERITRFTRESAGQFENKLIESFDSISEISKSVSLLHFNHPGVSARFHSPLALLREERECDRWVPTAIDPVTCKHRSFGCTPLPLKRPLLPIPMRHRHQHSQRRRKSEMRRSKECNCRPRFISSPDLQTRHGGRPRRTQRHRLQQSWPGRSIPPCAVQSGCGPGFGGMYCG